MLFYSYLQIQVNLTDASYYSIDWMDFSLSTIVKLGLDAFSGNLLSAAFDLIDGINLNLYFGLSNFGFLPVYFPDLNYELLINNIPMGKGSIQINTIIYPGETKEVSALQNFKKSGLTPVVASFVSSDGILDLKVKGTAYLDLLGFDIPVPFESSKRVSIYNEIKNRILNEPNQKVKTSITLNVPTNSVYEGNTLLIGGRLTSSDGNTLQNAIIFIKDEDSGSGDDNIATLSTDSFGNFGFIWNAKSMDPFDNVVEFYAVFEGSSGYESAKSYQYNVSVIASSEPIKQNNISKSTDSQVKQNLSEIDQATSSYINKVIPTLADFKNTLSESQDIDTIFFRFGEPNRDIGNGIHIYVYDLNDSTQVWIGYTDHILSVHHMDSEGNLLEQLFKENKN